MINGTSTTTAEMADELASKYPSLQVGIPEDGVIRFQRAGRAVLVRAGCISVMEVIPFSSNEQMSAGLFLLLEAMSE
jgi:hypothetical protein